MQVILANPRGFCAGVDRAISIVEQALTLYGAPIYVRHEIVHNRSVVQMLRQRGVMFVEHLDQVPDDAIVVFSAHGVAQEVHQAAKLRRLTVLDAACPLVTKVHMQVARASRAGVETILIGHRNHPEVTGTMGQYDNPHGGMYLVENLQQISQLAVKDENQLCYVTQTTLSIEDTTEMISALQARFPNIVGPRKNDICYATTNRQVAVRDLALKAAVILVVGSQNSSNSNSLVEVVQRLGKPAYLIDSAEEIQPAWVDGAAVVGVTAGASAPESLVQGVVERLRAMGAMAATEIHGREEQVIFPLPRVLQVGAART